MTYLAESKFPEKQNQEENKRQTERDVLSGTGLRDHGAEESLACCLQAGGPGRKWVGRLQFKLAGLRVGGWWCKPDLSPKDPQEHRYLRAGDECSSSSREQIYPSSLSLFHADPQKNRWCPPVHSVWIRTLRSSGNTLTHGPRGHVLPSACVSFGPVLLTWKTFTLVQRNWPKSLPPHSPLCFLTRSFFAHSPTPLTVQELIRRAHHGVSVRIHLSGMTVPLMEPTINYFRPVLTHHLLFNIWNQISNYSLPETTFLYFLMHLLLCNVWQVDYINLSVSLLQRKALKPRKFLSASGTTVRSGNKNFCT